MKTTQTLLNIPPDTASVHLLHSCPDLPPYPPGHGLPKCTGSVAAAAVAALIAPDLQLFHAHGEQSLLH